MRAAVTRYAMFAPGQTVVVGVSGGPDSTALLHALVCLQNEWQLSLVACHVNHGFRGAESEAEADYTRTLCTRLNVPCHVFTVDVPGLQKRRHLSAQEAARFARHRFLHQLAAQTGAERIALAHIRDDRVESVLLNLFRGSGLEGLSGFPPIEFPLVRPLYDTTRAHVEAYCAHYELEPRHDSSNTKTNYRRNRIRLELLPTLRDRFNPKVDEALLRMADMAREDNAWLEQSATEALNRLLTPANPLINSSENSSTYSNEADSLVLPLIELQALPIALRRRVLRQAILCVRGHLQNISFDLIEKFAAETVKAENKIEMIRVIRSEQNAEDANDAEEKRNEVQDNSSHSEELPAAGAVIIRIVRDSEQIMIVKEQARASAIDWQAALNISERTFIPQANVNISIYSCLTEDLPGLVSNFQSEIQSEFQQDIQRHDHPIHPITTFGNHIIVAIWDRSTIRLPLIARSWRPGDRMRPSGLGGTKKIQDLFTDAKIPSQERKQHPLLIDNTGTGRILALGSLRMDDTALLTMRLPCALSASLQKIVQIAGTPKEQEYTGSAATEQEKARRNALERGSAVSQRVKELIVAVWEYG